ncbi:MAG TPA: quinone-dependent dihydroorotate dehydrogenase [Gaiellaceae bacterium]|nr:quinone-dependent dihydroorotate dehydrogenase [Gaiellaceae bacterium]
MYGLLYRLLLARLDAETAHRLALRGLAVLGRVGRAARHDPVLRVRALGLEFASPLGVAAGLDKEAAAVAGLAALGFGHVEVGTVTALPQPGRPRPRLWRYPAARALVNRMGFPNAGAAAIAARLERRRPGVVVGVNVGKSAAAEDAVADYRRCAEAVAPVADYLVVNVSSPNTVGLRDLQEPDRLREIVRAVRAAAPRTPLLVKIAPDLAGAAIDAVVDLALAEGLDGIVATNTTVERPGGVGADRPEGGLSGAPLRERSLAVLRRLHERAGGRLVLVSVGGVESGADLLERIRAGATLVQAYTGFVYGGPRWPRRVERELARLVRAAGAASVQQLVGKR